MPCTFLLPVEAPGAVTCRALVGGLSSFFSAAAACVNNCRNLQPLSQRTGKPQVPKCVILQTSLTEPTRITSICGYMYIHTCYTCRYPYIALIYDICTCAYAMRGAVDVYLYMYGYKAEKTALTLKEDLKACSSLYLTPCRVRIPSLRTPTNDPKLWE